MNVNETKETTRKRTTTPISNKPVEIYDRPLENSKRYIANCETSEENREELTKYLNAMIIGSGVKQPSNYTKRGIIYWLTRYCKHLENKTLATSTKEDLEGYKALLVENKLADSTINSGMLWIKTYFRWKDGKISERADWIKRDKRHKRKITESALWQPSEIKALIEKTTKPRDKAFISGLYESAARIGEWVNIRIGDIKEDSLGMKIRVEGKTGERTIRIINSVHYIKDWLNKHPYKNREDWYVFINLDTQHTGRRVYPANMGRLMKELRDATGINKKIHPHLLRHSRLTWLGQHGGFNERDLRLFAGWSPTSDMPNTYLHYNEEALDNKLAGDNPKAQEIMKKVNTERIALQEKNCPICNTTNPPDQIYCQNEKCRYGIGDLQIAAREKKNLMIEEFMKRLLEQPMTSSKKGARIEETMLETIKNNGGLLREFMNISKEV